MPLAFSEEECRNIRNALLENASLFIETRSVSDITVDELAKSVGISKGAFYKFFHLKNRYSIRYLDKCITKFMGQH